jgi:hypothetical protein
MTLPVPAKVFRKGHTVVLGKTGSGKSSVLRLITENLLGDDKRVCIVDPKGDWWGLKKSGDGKSAGFPVIAFGDFKEPRATDVPINQHSGKEVAQLIATGNRPCIIGFRGWMVSHMIRFWLDFAQTLFNQNTGELYVVISEVQNFAPKGKIFDPEAGKCLHWTNKILSEGRGLGLTFLLDSQRPQKVHNDTLDNCETLVAMRVVHPRSREAIEEWMDGAGDPAKAKEILATLSQMKTGEAYVWSPENNFGPTRVQFPMFETFDSFAPPQSQKHVSNAGWSTVDLEAVKEKLSAVIAEHKANDPKELKAEIARLKAEAGKLHATNRHVATVNPSKQELERACAAAVRTATAPLLARIASIRKQARQVTVWIQSSTGSLSRAAAALSEEANIEAPEIPHHQVVVPPPQHPPTNRPQTAPRPAPAVSSSPADPDADTAISPGMRKILAAAAQFNGIDPEELTTITGYKATSRNEYTGRLIRAGLAEKRSDKKIYPTAAGMDALGQDYEALPTGQALYQWWNARLPEGEQKILRHLVEAAAGADVDKNELSAAVGYKSTSLNEYIGRLSRRRLVVKGSGTVKANESLFG